MDRVPSVGAPLRSPRRKAALLTFVLLTGSVALTAAPAGANHEPWGFGRIDPVSGPAGTYVFAPLFPPEVDGAPYDPSAITPGPAELCSEVSEQVLLDRFGAIVATRAIAATRTTYELPGRGRYEVAAGGRFPLRIPDGLAPGRYWIHTRCVLDGHLHSGCIRFEVTAPGTPVGAIRTVDDSTALERHRCPVSLLRVLGESLLGARWAFLGLHRTLFPPSTVPDEPLAATTTTTRRPPEQPPGAPPPTLPPVAPPADSTLPIVSGVTVQDGPNGCPTIAVVGWSASDNVGVSSVTVRWTGSSAGSRDVAPGSSPTSIGPIAAGFINVTVEARDAAGNIGSATVSQFQC